MKAFVHEGRNGLEGTNYQEMQETSPNAGEVKVKLKYAGLNHRDLFVLERHKESDPALIIGSDGAGIIEEIGEGVTRVNVGDEVVIDAALGWHNKTDAPPAGFQLIGLPGHGTFAEYITVPADNVEPKPDHLTWDEAGVLPLAGLTAYRALFTRANVQSGNTVLLPGIGSGAATYLLLFAKAIGARVIVTSRSEYKRNKALELGADLALDSNQDWEKALENESIDIAVETVGAATFNKTLDQLRKGGTIVTFGASAGDQVTIDIRKFFYGQYNLLGTTMGSHEEFKEMLQLVNKYNIKPVMDNVYPLSETSKAMQRLSESEQFGKIGIEINS
ncbi:zinc-binding dehydrogenase [Pontibacillus yanchengensis]|uniref:Alcohol dehydrogenase n=1 Tax=Pontibacillus yanchengensis Y32 TaxID=1385514 RepID=A0A0A2T667_9BACI|nr:zinc-binding dehydrogenase [Pontibacillus yanchengensis]KGP71292.1 alcohol dehydrogenase [Pontibacillus yanchengensis Y32]